MMTRVKRFSVKKTFAFTHVRVELKNAQKQGKDYTKLNMTNLIQEEYPIHLFHTHNGIMEQM